MRMRSVSLCPSFDLSLSLCLPVYLFSNELWPQTSCDNLFSFFFFWSCFFFFFFCRVLSLFYFKSIFNVSYSYNTFNVYTMFVFFLSNCCWILSHFFVAGMETILVWFCFKQIPFHDVMEMLDYCFFYLKSNQSDNLIIIISVVVSKTHYQNCWDFFYFVSFNLVNCSRVETRNGGKYLAGIVYFVLETILTDSQGSWNANRETLCFV